MQFYPSRNAITWDSRLLNQTSSKSLLRFLLWSQKIKTTREEYFAHLPERPHWGSRYQFWLSGNIADLISRAKFCDNYFMGFGVLIPSILLFSIGLAGRSYNKHIPCHTVTFLEDSLAFTCLFVCLCILVSCTLGG